jgi:hypothetical protein
LLRHVSIATVDYDMTFAPVIDFTIVRLISARRVADPREVDWQAAKRVLRYWKGMASLALTFPSRGDVNLTTEADAD